MQYVWLPLATTLKCKRKNKKKQKKKGITIGKIKNVYFCVAVIQAQWTEIEKNRKKVKSPFILYKIMNLLRFLFYFCEWSIGFFFFFFFLLLRPPCCSQRASI